MKGGRLVTTLCLLTARPRAARRKARPFPSLAAAILSGALFVVPPPTCPASSAQPVLAPPRHVDHPRQASAGLSILRPYERGRFPSSSSTASGAASGSGTGWSETSRPMMSIRGRYQFWTFGYATGESIPFSALRLRRAIRRAREAFDPGGTDEAFDRMVVVGHSLGGLVAKMTAQTTGPRLWRTVSTEPPERLSGPAEDVRLLREAFIYDACRKCGA